MSFFDFWVVSLWGSGLLALIGTAVIFSVIGLIGRMSYLLLVSLLALNFVTFGVGFFGIAVYLPVFLAAVIYFGVQLTKFLSRE